MTTDVCIVGGAGHVGLPLAVALANSGLRVGICDRNEQSMSTIQRGEFPFQEQGGTALLRQLLVDDRLSFSSDMRGVAGVPVIVVTVGTPVDAYLNPDTRVIKQWADEALPHLSSAQLIVLRSTVYPGTTTWLEGYLRRAGLVPKLAFCPERIAQGFALEELRALPQLVSGTSPQAQEEAAALFLRIAPEVIRLTPLEAEFAKLFTNSYRYIVFGIVNQFYMLACEHGADFHRILHACRHHYPRMSGMPGPGFTAGPCLLKDTMQLAAFSNNQFSLGHHAMLVNEGLPAFLVNMVKRDMDLADKTAGILGMAFKGESDDARDSLSYRLLKLLQLEARRVICSDPYVRDPRLVPQEQVIAESQVIFVGAPHRCYANLRLPPDRLLVDVWNLVRPQPSAGEVGA
jgi:UDP-N-acetyl-D-mannosaminuronic acid dehydrogenase